jgi:hypothetical protein
MVDECSDSLGKFIIYACPVGELKEQLEDYFHKSLNLCGKNTAHNYSLTHYG